MNQSFFTKKHIHSIQGIAILWMLVHHLYAFNRIPQTYFSFLPVSILKILGSFGNICIAVFVFLSGYGIYATSKTKDLFSWRKHKLINTYLSVFVTFFCFVPLGFLFFNVTFDWKELLQNLTLLSFSYNKEWWFLRIYFELLLLAPYIVSALKKNVFIAAVSSIMISFLGLFIHETYFYNYILLRELSNLFLWQGLFFFGMLIYHFQILDKLFLSIERFTLLHGIVGITLFVMMIAFRELTPFPGKLKDPVLVLPFIIASTLFIQGFHLTNLFSFIGQQSLFIWLTHTFFCYYYTPSLIVYPGNSLLIFLWLLLISICVSLLLKKLTDFVKKIVERGFKYDR